MVFSLRDRAETELSANRICLFAAGRREDWSLAVRDGAGGSKRARIDVEVGDVHQRCVLLHDVALKEVWKGEIFDVISVPAGPR